MNEYEIFLPRPQTINLAQTNKDDKSQLSDEENLHDMKFMRRELSGMKRDSHKTLKIEKTGKAMRQSMKKMVKTNKEDFEKNIQN